MTAYDGRHPVLRRERILDGRTDMNGSQKFGLGLVLASAAAAGAAIAIAFTSNGTVESPPVTTANPLCQLYATEASQAPTPEAATIAVDAYYEAGCP